jgi:hypothetical protein
MFTEFKIAFRQCYYRVIATPIEAAKRKTADYIKSRQKKCVECKEIKLIVARGCCK